MFYLRIKYFVYSRLFRFFFKRKFKIFGKNIRIIFPLQFYGLQNIIIHDNVTIAYKAYISALPLTGEKECILEIGAGVKIGNFSHIFSTKEIRIEKNVLIADKVYISDNLHSYKDINVPVINQGLKQLSTVTIGEGSWIGENVCIIGSKIGKNCVIGVNSVVTRDIPDYCVAVGAPARVIKQYNLEKKVWEKV